MQISLIVGGSCFWVQLQVQIGRHEEEEEGWKQTKMASMSMILFLRQFAFAICLPRYFAACVNYDRDSN